MQDESVSTWHFMMGWMTVFNTRQVASWQLEVATGQKCIVCRTVEEMEKHREEIVEKKLVKLGFLGAKLGGEGHPWET